jgi:clan AA aspartic protease (TIGR02281 family)
MFHILLSLVVGIFIGWNFHIFFLGLTPQTLKNNRTVQQEHSAVLENRVSSVDIIERNISTSKPIPENNSTDYSIEPSFQTLLAQKRFSDAMAFYMEGDEGELKRYRLMLKAYFRDNIASLPSKTIEEILEYIDIEPNNRDIKIYLAKIYKEQKRLHESIKILLELKDDYMDEREQQLIEITLKDTIQTHIENLRKRKEFKKLINFLEEIIAVNSSSNYIITLAEIYTELNLYDKATKLLGDIRYDSTYATKSAMILRTIEKRKKELEQYTHKFPLEKNGSHYSIKLTIDNKALTLLLDTGATYTFIDEAKAPQLNMIKEIHLNSAGGEITAQLCRVNSLQIESLELKNFEVTVAPFKHKNADGLLGMNFFEKFKFMIDQERSMLYLSEK